MVVCFAVIVQFNSNVCVKISHHMSHEFDNQFYVIGYGIYRENICLKSSISFKHLSHWFAFTSLHMCSSFLVLL